VAAQPECDVRIVVSRTLQSGEGAVIERITSPGATGSGQVDVVPVLAT